MVTLTKSDCRCPADAFLLLLLVILDWGRVTHQRRSCTIGTRDEDHDSHDNDDGDDDANGDDDAATTKGKGDSPLRAEATLYLCTFCSSRPLSLLHFREHTHTLLHRWSCRVT